MSIITLFSEFSQARIRQKHKNLVVLPRGAKLDERKMARALSNLILKLVPKDNVVNLVIDDTLVRRFGPYVAGLWVQCDGLSWPSNVIRQGSHFPGQYIGNPLLKIRGIICAYWGGWIRTIDTGSKGPCLTAWRRPTGQIKRNSA